MELSKKLTPQWVTVEHDGELLELLIMPLRSWEGLNVQVMAEEGRAAEAALAAIRYAVRDWRGVTDGGNPVPFSLAALEQHLAPLDMGIMMLALGKIIVDRSRLTETERKN